MRAGRWESREVSCRLPRKHAAEGEPRWLNKLNDRESKVEEATREVKEEVAMLLPRYLADAEASYMAGNASMSEIRFSDNLPDRIRSAVDTVKEGLVERDTEVRLMLLATMCGEHLLLLGPPGTAKSELSRRLAQLSSGYYFERLLTRFSVPEELFGPLSLAGLERDVYERQLHGYLPTASVAFVDEIFKANSAILNSLLSILNERVFDNGSQRVDVPLICMVGASNELPESEELDALYDRFLIRREVSQVSKEGVGELLMAAGAEGTMDSIPDSNDFFASSSYVGSSVPRRPTLSAEEMRGVKDRALKAVTVPQEVVDLLVDLRTHLQEKTEPPVYVSDRRLVKIVAMLRVIAYTCGRTQVNEYDCLMLQHVMWNRPEECEAIREWVLDRIAVDKGTNQVSYLLNGVFRRACQAQTADGQDFVACAALASEAGELRKVLVRQLGALSAAGGGELPVLRDHLWLSQADITRSTQTLGPMLKKARKDLEKLLEETLTLEVALMKGPEPYMLALLMPEYWKPFIRNGPIEQAAEMASD